MAEVYITFDDYYSVTEYNEFLTAAKNNSIEFYEYISTRQPFNWYLKIDDKYVPNFVNYEEITSADKKFICNVMKPRRSNEVPILLRRETDNPKNFEKFISPKSLIEAKDAPYAMFFKSSNKDEVRQFSKDLGDIPIYRFGEKTQRKGYIWFCANKYIKGIIPEEQVLLEKTTKSEYNQPGELEYMLNFKVLVTEKIEGKGIEMPYFKDGKWYPLKASKFI